LFYSVAFQYVIHILYYIYISFSFFLRYLLITQKESIDLQKLRDNSTYQCVGARIDPSLEKLEYPRNDIIYIRDIGQGAFGRVFQVSATRN
jgi:hypothetical protein